MNMRDIEIKATEDKFSVTYSQSGKCKTINVSIAFHSDEFHFFDCSIAEQRAIFSASMESVLRLELFLSQDVSAIGAAYLARHLVLNDFVKIEDVRQDKKAA